MTPEETIKNQVHLLAPQLRQYVGSDVWTSTVSEIAKKNNFSEDQKVLFENEVLFVLIGFELARDFKMNIQTNVSIPEILAHDISEEVQENIFKEVIDFLPTQTEEEASQENPVISNQYSEKEKPSAPMELGEVRAPELNSKFMVNGEPISGAPRNEVASNQYPIHSMGVNQTISLDTPIVKPTEEKKSLNILDQQSFVPKTPLEAKLAEQPLNAVDTVVTVDKKYGGPDPYREAV